jgi:hypothetical protein
MKERKVYLEIDVETEEVDLGIDEVEIGEVDQEIEKEVMIEIKAEGQEVEIEDKGIEKEVEVTQENIKKIPKKEMIENLDLNLNKKLIMVISYKMKNSLSG